MYYKVEAYRASEQAGKILNEQGITPVYVSDNPVINAQHVLFEAAKAYRYGLPYHVALAGVTSASAELLGLGERIGKVKPGYDADVVVWDSDPLSVGAAPVQVWIDGAAQFDHPVELKKTSESIVPDSSAQETHDILAEEANAIFTGITRVTLPGHKKDFTPDHRGQTSGTLIMTNGKITCLGSCESESHAALEHGFPTLALKNGHISSPLIAFGSSLGLEEIAGEEDTQDGTNGDDAFSAAVDGLLLEGKGLAAAYRHGVTRAISAPAYKDSGSKGVSVGFRTGALNALEPGAVWRERVALHYSLTLNVKQGKTSSLSSAVGELRGKLLRAVKRRETEAAKEDSSDEDVALSAVVKGTMPLVVTVHSADIIASLLRVKDEVQGALKQSLKAEPLRLIVLGGAESHILASELAAADVGVVLAPMLPYAVEWDQRRSLTGAPLTNGTALDVLVAAGVKVGISTAEDWETRDLDLAAGVAFANGGGKLSETEAWDLANTNIYEMLGLEVEKGTHEFVVYEGNPLRIDSRVRAVNDGRGKASIWT